jgi:sterol desaturase/sphingolipid hydroxylase (fatty acid hydroxylase superfamily)
VLLLSVVFHHSNLELPVDAERRLNAVVVTPRMHGIHHSTRFEETDSNYSSLLSCWDRLHRSFRNDVPQETVTIGVAGFTEPRDVSLERSLLLPFADDPRLMPPASRADDGLDRM